MSLPQALLVTNFLVILAAASDLYSLLLVKNLLSIHYASSSWFRMEEVPLLNPQFFFNLMKLSHCMYYVATKVGVHAGC